MERLTEEQLHQRLAQLGKSFGPRGSIVDRVVRQLDHLHAPARPGRRERIIMLFQQKRAIAWAAGLAVAAIILGSALVLPYSQGSSSAQSWWLQPSSAWAAEVVTTLDTTKTGGFACRGLTIRESPDGKQHTSSTTIRSCYGRTSYRRDIYDGDMLREMQWYVPGQSRRLMVACRNDTRSFTILDAGDLPQDQSPIDRMKSMVGFVDQADRQLGEQDVEGRKCVGFEINASKYGDNPETWLKRIWFDQKSKLPVRMELIRPSSEKGITAVISVEDQFDYHPQLTDEVFIPRIPAGYVEIHPDQLKQPQGAESLTDEEATARLGLKAENLPSDRGELQKIISSIADAARVPCVVNWQALEKQGITASAQTAIPRGATFEQALKGVLHKPSQSEQIGVVVRNGIAVISTVTASPMTLQPGSDTLSSAGQ